jgi:hypothetical protein
MRLLFALAMMMLVVLVGVKVVDLRAALQTGTDLRRTARGCPW